jgi:hypothetical protein
MAGVEGEGYEYKSQRTLALSEEERNSLINAEIERDNILATGEVLELPEVQTEEDKKRYVRGWVQWAEDSGARVETSVMSESETLELEVARRNKQQGSCDAMEAWSERDRTKPTRMSVEMREEFETDSKFHYDNDKRAVSALWITQGRELNSAPSPLRAVLETPHLFIIYRFARSE